MKYLLILLLAFPVMGDEILIRAATHVIKKNEGVRLKPYRDTNGYWTIGIGHKIKPGESFDSITKKQAVELFRKDIIHHIKRAKRLLPEFNKYPIVVRVAVLDGVYRGCLSGSPNTLALMRKGLWEKAAREYLNHAEYRDSKKSGTGVYKRMDRNALVFLRYAEYLKRK